MKKSIVLIPLPSLIKNSFVRSFVLSLSLSLSLSIYIYILLKTIGTIYVYDACNFIFTHQ